VNPHYGEQEEKAHLQLATMGPIFLENIKAPFLLAPCA